MNKRDLKLDGYGISRKRYKELCGFCEQYPDWKNELKNHAYISAVQYSDDPKSANHDNSDTTAKHALRMLKYKRNVDIVEKVAKEVDSDYWEYLIKHICYEVPIKYLISVEECGLTSSIFYDRRRFFFYLLDMEKNKE